MSELGLSTDVYHRLVILMAIAPTPLILALCLFLDWRKNRNVR